MYICTRIYIHTTELDFIIPTTFGKSLPYTFRENRVLFSSLVRSLWLVQIIGYFSACRSHSFVCTLLHPRDSISLSSVCKHIWRHCNICNIWGCVLQFTHFPCDDWENKYIYICLIIIIIIIIIIKSEVWTIIHCLGLGHETMVCAECLPIFLQ